MKISGRHGAEVANNGAIAPFVSSFVTQELPNIAAHGGSELTVGSPLKFLAPDAAQDSKTLIKVIVEDWDANLNHILLAHSDPVDVPKETYSAEVIAA